MHTTKGLLAALLLQSSLLSSPLQASPNTQKEGAALPVAEKYSRLNHTPTNIPNNYKKTILGYIDNILSSYSHDKYPINNTELKSLIKKSMLSVDLPISTQEQSGSNAPEINDTLSKSPTTPTIPTIITLEFSDDEVEILLLDVDIAGNQISSLLLYQTPSGLFAEAEGFPLAELYIVPQKHYKTSFCDDCYRLDDFTNFEIDLNTLVLKTKILKEDLLVSDTITDQYLAGERGLFINYRATKEQHEDASLYYNLITGNSNGFWNIDASFLQSHHKIGQVRYTGYIGASHVYQVGDVSWSNANSRYFTSGKGVAIGSDMELMQKQNIYSSNSYFVDTYAPADYELYKNGTLVRHGKISDDQQALDNIMVSGIADYELKITDRYGDIQSFRPQFKPSAGLIKKDVFLWNTSLYKEEHIDSQDTNAFTASAKYGITDSQNISGGTYLTKKERGIDATYRLTTRYGVIGANVDFNNTRKKMMGVDYTVNIDKLQLSLNYEQQESSRIGIFGSYYMHEAAQLNFTYYKSQESTTSSLTLRGSFKNNTNYSLGFSQYSSEGREENQLAAFIRIPFDTTSVTYARTGDAKNVDINLMGDNYNTNISHSMSDPKSSRIATNYKANRANVSHTLSSSDGHTKQKLGVSGGIAIAKGYITATANQVDAAILIKGHKSQNIKVNNLGVTNTLSENGGLIPSSARQSQSICMDTTDKPIDYSLKEKCLRALTHRGYVGNYELKVSSGGVHIFIPNLDPSLPKTITLIINDKEYTYYSKHGVFLENLSNGPHAAKLYNGTVEICNISFTANVDYSEQTPKCEVSTTNSNASASKPFTS